MDQFLPLLGDSSPLKRNYYRSSSPSSQWCGLQRQTKLMFLITLFILMCLAMLVAFSCPTFLCSHVPYAHRVSPQAQELDQIIPNLLPDTLPINLVTYANIHDDDFVFNMTGSDVMVFLHMQKTGGTTFGKHLVQDIDLENPCKCWRRHRKLKQHPMQALQARKRVKRKTLTCNCFRPGSISESWLFSRYNTGWKCGLHADWTELTACVDHHLDATEGHRNNRRYFYVSFLRNPVYRYLSEYHHVHRGATWDTSMHKCNGRLATESEIIPCYQGPDWYGVELRDFLSCGTNLANNRQTRMLADLRLVNCYNKSGAIPEERESMMLNSAKQNLDKLAFFGLTEHQAESQILFEETFNLHFKQEFKQHDGISTHDILDQDILEQIKRRNRLDIELYDFARGLLMSRIGKLLESSPDLQSKFTKIKTSDTEAILEEDEDYS